MVIVAIISMLPHSAASDSDSFSGPIWPNILGKYGVVNVQIVHRCVWNMAYANSADPDQTAPEQSDQDLHCLPFHEVF